MLLGPLVSVIAEDFGLKNETEIGNISAIFLLIAGFISFGWVVVENQLAKRNKSSRKQLLFLSTIIWVGGLYLTSLASTYIQLFIFQMISAVGFAAITPLAFSMAMDLTSPENRAKTFGLLDIAAMIGAAGIGYLLPGLLVDFLPWNIPFIIIATCGLIFALFALKIRDPKKGIQDLELSNIISQGAEYTFYIDKKSLKLMVKKGTNLLILSLNIILNLASGSITYYFIRMMVNDHLFSSSLAVLLFVVAYSSQVIGAVFWTKRADKKFERGRNGKIKVLVECILIGPGFLILAYSLKFTVTSGIIIVFFIILLALGAFFLSGLIAITFATLGEINPPELRTTVFSLNNLAQTFGRGIGILLLGIFYVLWSGIYQYGFIIMSSLYFGAILLILPLLNSVPKEILSLNKLLKERAKTLK